MDIKKGTPVSIKTKFKRKGVVATFVNPPVWILYGPNGKKLLSGVATNSGSDWIAEFTIPVNYPVPEGKQDMELEFTGFDSKNQSHVKSIDVTLIDESNDLQPVGVVYSIITESKLKDTITSEADSLEKIEWKILTPAGVVVAYGELTDAEPSSSSSDGYTYKLDMGKPIIPEPVVQNDPYLIVIDVYADADEEPETEIHPLYILTAKMATLVNQLTQYLDKARLTEIDPSLQWTMPEYMHYILEGVKHINSSMPEPSYWTVQDMPTILRQALFSSAALYALNARYLAEGFNAVEFTGLNTNFNLDRREAIVYKIEEMRSYLEALPNVKKTAIAANGTGTAPPGEADTRSSRIGVLGAKYSPVSNRINRWGRGRRNYLGY